MELSRLHPRWEFQRSSPIREQRSSRQLVSRQILLTAILQIQSAVLVVSVLKKLQKITQHSIQKHLIRLDCRLIWHWTVLENINIKVAEKNISIIHRQSICFSSPQDVAIMKCSSSIQRWLMKKAKRSIWEVSLISISQRRVYRLMK